MKIKLLITLLYALLTGAFSFIPARADVEQWHPTDLSFTSTATYTNPFQDVSISTVSTTRAQTGGCLLIHYTFGGPQTK